MSEGHEYRFNLRHIVPSQRGRLKCEDLLSEHGHTSQYEGNDVTANRALIQELGR